MKLRLILFALVVITFSSCYAALSEEIENGQHEIDADTKEVINGTQDDSASCVSEFVTNEKNFSAVVERKNNSLASYHYLATFISNDEKKAVEKMKMMLRYEDAIFMSLEIRRKIKAQMLTMAAYKIIENLPELPREESRKIVRYEDRYGKEVLIKLGSDCSSFNYHRKLVINPDCPTVSLSLFKYYISGGAFVNSQHERQANALHTAVRFDKLDIVRYLVQQTDIRVNDVDRNGKTPLDRAVEYGYCDIVKYLVNDTNSKYSTNLFLAATDSCNECIVNTILSYKQFGNIEKYNFCNGTEDILYRASKCGNVDLVKNLVNNGCDVNVRHSSDYETPLHQAAYYGHISVVTYLVNNASANVSIRNRDGETALVNAARKGHLDITMFLVKTLYDNGYNVNAKQNRDGRTPLHLAAEYGYFPVVTYLINNASANASIRDINRDTALVEASNKGHLEITKFLVKIAVDNKDKDSITRALINAANNNNLDMVKYLIAEAHADLFANTSDGYDTVLDAAARWNSIDIIKYLVGESGIREINGETALHIAAKYQYLEIVQYLVLDIGMDVRALNKKGETALQVAEKEKYKSSDVIEWLEKQGN